MHQRQNILLFTLFIILAFSNLASARDNGINTTDPTLIYSGFGVSAQQVEYKNGDSRQEVRGAFAWTLNAEQMLLLEAGYGRHDDGTPGGETNDLTRSRLMYRQRLPFNDNLTTGFRGMIFEADLNFSGELAGTDGQTLLRVGATPAVGISESFDFYPAVRVVNSFDKNFRHYNGAGFDLVLRLDYAPDYLWPGALFQLEPGYSQFAIGQLAFKHFHDLRVAIGGNLFEALHWRLSADKQYGRQLSSWRGSNSAGMKEEWSAGLQILATF